MDCGSIYIKMCEKAEEIQKEWKPSEWDYCFCRVEDEMVVLSGYETDSGWYGHGTPVYSGVYGDLGWFDFDCGGIETIEEYKTQHIWLPRQDQLQAMVFTLDESIIARVTLLKEFVQGNFEYILKFHSMEQLWLAFVMKERWNKIWDGEDWILST